MYTQTVRTPANPITYALGQKDEQMGQVNFRMKDERLALIDRAAAIRGVTRTEFVLRSSETAAIETLLTMAASCSGDSVSQPTSAGSEARHTNTVSMIDDAVPWI